MGYHQAGFEVVGVDINPQPNYPFTFVQADATNPPLDLDSFDLVHASPPCQHFSRYRNAVKDIEERYENLIPETQALLRQSGKPYVIENVPKAPIRNDLQLCGSMFGLDVRRHRWFELEGFEVPSPECNHKVWPRRRYNSSTGRKNLRFTIEVGAWDEPLALQKQAMGVDWTLTVRELSEAVPPRFARFIGEAFVQGREDAL
jgi:DNA (cytosine-5)-methyltransferase 1